MSTEISRLFDFPYYAQKKYNLKKALVTKYHGKWVATSSEEYLQKVNQMSRALTRLGVKANDKVAIISTNNRTEWNIMDISILQVGAQNVPIYPTISKEDYLPYKVQYYAKNGTHLKTLSIEETMTVDDRIIPKTTMMHNHQKGSKTQIQIQEIQINLSEEALP